MQRRKGMRLRGGFKWAAVLIIAVVLVGFDLLSDNASIVNRGMVAGLAVDGSGELIELAAQVILPGSGGSSAGGNDFMIFTSSGKTMQDAIEKLSVTMGVKASLAHCTLVILGEDLLRTRSEAVMKHFIRSPYFADNTLLVAASGRASDVLAAKVPINEVASYHLQRMMQGVQREAGVNASTVKDYFAEYYYIGGASCMPLAVVSDCEYSPVGPGSEGGEGAQLQFSLEKFAAHFSLNAAQARYALRYLESSGHISWAEDVTIDTRVRILAGRDELYDISLPDPRMPAVLEFLMRRYPGIFSYTVAVDEEALCSAVGVDVPRLHQLLYGLSLEHVIKYIPSDRSDVITLHHGRLMPGNLDLQMPKYEFLKRNAEERTEAMADYVSEEDECRSRWLLRYFGQENSAPCGTCDVCRAGAPVRRRLLAFAASHPGFTLQELKAWCDDPANSLPRNALDVYRSMLDACEIAACSE